MDQLELSPRRVTGLEGDERIVDARGMQPIGNRSQASNALGMTASGVVLRERWVVADEQHRVSVLRARSDRAGRARSPWWSPGTLGAVAERIKGVRTRHHSFGWARVVPWRGRHDIAHLVLAEGVPPERGALEDCLARLRRARYSAVVTSALTAGDSLPFVDAGFEVRERLHLLEHLVEQIPSATDAELSLRRAWRTDRPAVLELDSLAFDSFWRLDAESLSEALHATPAVRFRVGAQAHATEAYAITGRAGRRGYLQRVAVHPAARRQGFGRARVRRLAMARRHDVRRALVNTQWTNHGALALYESCGFRRLPVGLCVLDRTL